VNIIIAGGTGFLGGALCERLLACGHHVIVLTRKGGKASSEGSPRFVEWNGRDAGALIELMMQDSVIINLAGSSIAGRRWNAEVKRDILESRLGPAKAIVEAVRKSKNMPSVILQASAIGYYGNRGDDLLTEGSGRGTGFLSEVTSQWEASLDQLSDLGVRIIAARLGIVLEHDGGALKKMMIPFLFSMGGPIGDGKQWLSWIHRKDAIEGILHLIGRKDLEGPFNLTSPMPVRMRDFAVIVGRALRKPSWVKVPTFLVRALAGEMGDELLLASQRVLPEKLLSSGFEFAYGDLGMALGDIFPA
jgi:uncharacterized protein